jgi:hypothetical protein
MIMPYVLLGLGALSLIFGLKVFLRDRRDKKNIAFLIFSFIITAWTLNNFYLQTHQALDVIRLSYAIGVLIGLGYMAWLYTFLQRKVPPTFLYLTIPITLVLFYITTSTDLILRQFDMLTTFGFEGELGSFFQLLTSYFTIMTFSALYYMIQEEKDTNDQWRKRQVSVLIASVSFFALVSFSISYWIPRLFDTLRYTLFDTMNFFVLFFAAAYVMLRKRPVDNTGENM